MVLEVSGQEIMVNYDTISISPDTVKLVQESRTYYDYFSGKEDSLAVLLGSSSHYVKVFTLSKDGRNGSFKIYLNKILLYDYSVKAGKIDGVAFVYGYYNREIAVEANFNQDRLDGFLIKYDGPYDLRYIAKFKKGKFKKYMYYNDFTYYKNLRHLNRRKEGPLEEVVHEM